MSLRQSVRLILGGVLTIVGCSSEDIVEQLGAEARYEIAIAKFREGDYLDAIEEFKIITLQFQGSALADDAQFFMAECRYLREEYVLAAYEYEVLLRTMPTSEYVPRARYRRAICYYNLSPKSYLDQEYTRKAIDELQAYIEYHPTDSLVSDAEAKIIELRTKLAKKEYESGIIYMKMEYYKAATVYFDLVLERYHDTPFAEQALLRKAEALMRRRRYAEAKEAIETFLAKYPTSPLLEEAQNLQREIMSNLSANQTAVSEVRSRS
ncbi:MAG TPA: outer membrane protein assembly factor BamD [Bacteroidota bacterium]|nr:outer membrane protein assembly factor BamD [Bacteroidota bacterium]